MATIKKATAATLVLATSERAVVDVTLEKVTARDEERQMALEAAQSWSNTEWGKAILVAHGFTNEPEPSQQEPNDDDGLDLSKYDHAVYIERQPYNEKKTDHLLELRSSSERVLALAWAEETADGIAASDIVTDASNETEYLLDASDRQIKADIVTATQRATNPAYKATESLACEYGAAGIAWVREALARAYEAGRKAGEAR